jgi:alpha-L-arabinofuranosidase
MFYEEIQHAGDGGLYAEMLENRSFEEYRNGWEFEKLLGKGIMPVMDDLKNIKGWQLNGNGKMILDQSDPLNDNNPTSLKVELNGEVSIINAGFLPDGQQEGIGVGLACNENEKLELSFYAKANADFNGKIIVQLEGKDGKILAEKSLEGITNKWKKFSTELLSNNTDLSARLVLRANGTGALWLDMVSLFPKDTFKNRPNGLRKDIAEMLEALKPSFIRFPGGCFVEGLYQLNEAWRPLKTLGDVAERPGLPGARWQYGSTDGLGYYEMLQMCEDFNAKPLLVINTAMSHGDEGIVRYDDPNTQFPDFLNETLNAIKYANDDMNTKWGAERASDGHPKPFNLNYMEIGNEDGDFPSYDDRYGIFYKKIKEKNPMMNFIANAKLNTQGYPKNEPVEIIDEHYYTSVGWCIENFHKYDSYDRKGPKVYLGEFGVTDDPAFQTNKDINNLRTALGEAIFWLGAERNSDIVVMTSFAPLLCRLDQKMWPSNLIYFDQARVFGSPSYYVIKMLSNNSGDVNLSVKSVSNPVIIKTEIPSQKNRERFTDCKFPESIYAGATLNEKTSEVILKVINFSPSPQSATITLEGIKEISGNCTAEILFNKNITAINSFDDPLNVVPKTKKISCSGKELKYELKENSFTIIRIPIE